MASNRPNKQKRQRQNRQEREARRARSVHAGEATAIARGEREAAAPTTSARASGKGGETSGKSPRPRAESRFKIPGQRAVVMAFLFTLVSAVTLLVAPVQVQREVDADDPVLEEVDEDDQEATDDGTVTYLDDAMLLDEEGPAVAAGVILTPILITGVALYFTKRPQRTNVWTMAMIALAGYIFLFAGPYGIITLPALIALAVGGFQARRAENKERLAELRARKAQRDDEGGVIDVEATEDEPADTTDGAGEETIAEDDRR